MKLLSLTIDFAETPAVAVVAFKPEGQSLVRMKVSPIGRDDTLGGLLDAAADTIARGHEATARASRSAARGALPKTPAGEPPKPPAD